MPNFKDWVMGGSLTVWLHLDRSALCWTSVQVPQSPGSGAGTEQVLAPFQTAGLGFLFTGCSVAAELTHKLESCPDTESSHDRRMAQTGEVQKHASWGFGVTSLTLSPPSAFVLHLLPQAGQSRKSVRWDAEGEG